MRASIGGSNKASASPGTAAPALRGPALRERGRDRELPDLLVVTSPIRLECVRVPAGEFLMGSALAQDREATKGEQPLHRCYLAEFYIGKYPVTNSQYAAFVELAGHG